MQHDTRPTFEYCLLRPAFIFLADPKGKKERNSVLFKQLGKARQAGTGKQEAREANEVNLRRRRRASKCVVDY